MDVTTTLTAFDIAVIIVIGLSVVMAFGRGFATVALSLLAWFATIFGVVTLGELLTPYLRNYVEPNWLADTLTYAVLFIGGLILLKWIAGLIGGMIKNSPVGFLDRSLGALFGLLRGMVLVSAVYFGFVKLFPGDEPDWISKAETKPLVAWGAEMLSTLAAEALGKDPDEFGAEYLKRAEEAVPNQFINDMLEEQAAKYIEQQRDKLDELVEDVDNPDF
ncbi:CvpA family protein [Kordiimonas aquimaris]|uniref:CvpA family protein n=1 Tax=Kordiimonas aquimaris TaxID=707591 RepID=UPI0021CFBCBA|nr:CvpA family protein [Kordiimonas aquimaris]